MRTTWILLAVGLLGAVGLQLAGRLAQSPARPLPVLAQALTTAEACPGWQVRDEPIAASPEMQKAVGELLSYDDGILRVYTRGAETFTVYVAAWAPGKMSPRLIAGHTPDVCWVGGGWVKQDTEEVGGRRSEVDSRLRGGIGEKAETGDLKPEWEMADRTRPDTGDLKPELVGESRKAEGGGRKSGNVEKAEKPEAGNLTERSEVDERSGRPLGSAENKPALAGKSEIQVSGLKSQVSPRLCILPLGEYREFTMAGTRQYVLFWHVVGNEVMSYGTGAKPPWYAAITDLFRDGLNQRKEQFFIRISANRPLGELWDEPAFQAVLVSLHDLALGRVVEEKLKPES